MSQAKLHLAPGLDLPADVVTQAIAILARRGAGKSYTASVLVEEVVKAGLPVVVIDPTGAWYGLRTSADGKRPGLSVLILGGPHGDVQIKETAGREIADLVVDYPGAYVIDLSSFDTKASELRFVADFLERLYRAKGTKKNAMLLVVDEADTFAPQSTRAEGGPILRTLGALEAIASRGRIRGFGLLLVTQRSAKLHKNVLAQTEILIALQTTDPRDRAAIKAWVEGNGTPEEQAQVLGSLASLERGEAWVWSPSWLRLLKRVRIRKRETYDSGQTPEVGRAVLAPTARATVDLAALEARIAASVEQAKANDPNVLKSRLSTLEKELAAARAAKPPVPAPERVEVPVLRDAQIERLGTLVEQLSVRAKAIESTAGELRSAIDRVKHSDQLKENRKFVSSAPEPRPAPPAPRPRVNGADPHPELGKGGLRRMLVALAQRPRGLSTSQIGIRAQLSSSSGSFDTYLSRGRKAGWIAGDRSCLTITQSGLDALGEYEALPTGEDLLRYWIGEFGSSGAARMLQVLAEAYPETLTRAELGERANLSGSSGSFDTYLSRLRRLELVEGKSDLRASEELFS